jgi:DNA-binding NarL/FixJ family response regulator
VRVVIGEDELLMRQGLSLLLERAGFEVVAEASDGETIVAEARRLRPELVVTDIRMPPTYRDEGLRAALRIKTELPETGVMVLSHHVQRGYAMELLKGHASGVGYLLKQRVMDVDAFSHDLKTVAQGGTVLDPEVVTQLVSRARQATVIALTDQQERVLELMARGLSNAAIARDLHIREKSVVRHVSHVYDALGLAETPDAHRRVQAVVQHLWG